eukprot:gene7813-biopygen4587
MSWGGAGNGTVGAVLLSNVAVCSRVGFLLTPSPRPAKVREPHRGAGLRALGGWRGTRPATQSPAPPQPCDLHLSAAGGCKHHSVHDQLSDAVYQSTACRRNL